jgi:peptidoglycan/LPS O-acetylase OafA/YrhL
MIVSKTEKTRAHYIDTLRGIAILGIFIAHVGTYAQVSISVQAYLSLGTIGVQLFFILSAYTLCLNYEAIIKINLYNFYINRFIRIFPLFWLFILINLAVYGLEIRHHAPEGITKVDIFLNFLGIGWLKPDAINGVVDGAWFVFSLLIFYAFFPFLIRWKNDLYKLMWLVTIAFVLRIIFYIVTGGISKLGLIDNMFALHYGNFFYYQPINHLFSFLIGFLTYYLINTFKVIDFNKIN